MNPSLSITVDSNRKLSINGVVAVYEKVDVSISGIDENLGSGLRLRIVDVMGHDLFKYPIKSTDTWTYANAKYTAEVNLDTDKLRDVFSGMPFDAKLDLGIIVDSYSDAMEYGKGRIKLRQWSASATEDPTVMPNWYTVLNEIRSGLSYIDEKKIAAETAATDAKASNVSAGNSANEAGLSATYAYNSANSAASSKTDAETARDDAESYSESASTSATNAATAASHYPKIESGTWWVWNVDEEKFVDTHVSSTGDDGITPHIDSTTGNWFLGSVNTGIYARGDDGITPHIDETTGNWFIGTTDTCVHAKGDQGDPGEVTTAALNAALALKQDNLVSGTNIKTINGEPIIGSGDLSVVTDISNCVKKTGETSQTVDGELHVGGLAVDGVRVEIVSELPADPIPTTIYFVTGS